MDYVRLDSPTKDDFAQAIIEDNCLSKPSGRTRQLTFRHLAELYALDSSVPIFRVMLSLWKKEAESRPLLALLCAYPRDAILRKSFEWIAQIPYGAEVSRESIEGKLMDAYPDRFSPASIKSIAQNLNGTWTKTGHLLGKRRKIRQRVTPTTAATVFALYLGHISGLRGESLFSSEYCKLLDAPSATLMDKAEAASRRGWLTMKRLGNVVEVLFPELITPEESRLLNEQ